MSDNTTLNTGTGGDVIATDDLTTLNGGAVSGVKAQRVKIGFGPDGSLRDVESANPLPTSVGDGTNEVTVKPASTLAVSTDTALVVSLRDVAIGTNGGLSVKGESITAVSTNFAAAGTGTAGPVNVSDAGNCTFIVKNQIAATAFTGSPVLVFEQSDDNTSWGPLTVTRGDTCQTNTTFTVAPPGASAEIMFNASCPGISYVRCRVTTGTTTNGMTINISPGGFLYAPQVGTIDRKDAARTPFMWYAEAVAGATTEALVTMTAVTVVGTAGTAATTYAVPVGKTLRLTGVTISFVSTSTTANTSRVRIRALASGTAAVSSPIIWSSPRIGWPSATFILNEGSSLMISLPDGFEFVAGNSLGVTHLEAAANGTVDILFTGFLY